MGHREAQVSAPEAPAPIAESADRWRAHAAAINAAFPVDPDADAAIEALMVKQTNHATRPLTKKVTHGR